uniref:Uncharacterized protein n=1 Tax=Setaria viridis TaxID=4556 RepID=A0A4U6UX79_SETVI|nr:hypothetical protein SEVIR_4G174800v2 [Setaria viridis]
MCLPFICGGGGDREHGSPIHPGIQHPPPPPPRSPSPPPRYDTTSPFQETYDHRSPGMAAGGEANSPRYVAGVNKNAERITAFDNSRQAPRQREDVSASPRFHGSVAASHPKESGDKMWAPPVAQMGRRGGEDDYPTAAGTTPTPAANNFYGDRDHAFGNNRMPQGNSLWYGEAGRRP